MPTIFLEEPGRFTQDTAHSTPPADLAPHEALVRVRRVGICGTDYHAYRGKQPFFSYPRILGHELGVEIVAVGSESRGLKPGDSCAVEPYLYCGVCSACRRGKTNCCMNLKVLGVHVDGGMRDYLRVPLANLHPSATLSLDHLALVETLGIGAHAVTRAGLESGERVLVIGAGPIGLSVVQFTQIAGAHTYVLDTNAERLAFCREQFGVAGTLEPGEDTLASVQDALGGELPTTVFDATGNPASMTGAFRLVGQGGKLIFVGLFPGEVTFQDPEFHRKEMTLFASRNSTAQDFTAIIQRMESGAIDTMPWISHRADSAELIERFPHWLDPQSRVIKAMVSF